MSKAQVNNIVLGPVSTNCLLIKNKETKELIIVDPPADPNRRVCSIDRLDATPVAIILTHGHFDHICAVNELRDHYKIEVYACAAEEDVLANPMLNLSTWGEEQYRTKADHWLNDGDELHLAGFEIHMMHTPGHTHGSCCYYFPEEQMLVSGDTLFCGSVGRTDFPTSSTADMKQSVRRLLAELPEETAVFPGHDQSTTISYEKRYNPFA